MKPRVFKFGGTSLATADSLLKVISLIRLGAPKLCVVVSASSGVTDTLYKIYYGSLRGEVGDNPALIAGLEDKHIHLVRGVITNRVRRENLEASIRATIDELRRISDSLSILREDTPRVLSRAVSYGERLMAAIVSETLMDHDVPAALVDSTRLIKMSRDRQDYAPDDAKSKAAVESILPALLDEGKVVVIPGFFGEGPDGEVMILGRGGSDYTATLLGGYLEAREVCLYKEVDGLMTADPRHVFDARVLAELHYREAAELAYFGAKVLHPRAIIPLVANKIPLIVKNTFFPEKPGTRIDGKVAEKGFPVKALSYIGKQALIAVEGKGMMGVPGIASKAFGAMAHHGISTSFITQASSEASISFVVPGEQGLEAKKALEEAFRFEIDHQLIDDVKLQSHIAILAVVGLGMRGTPGIAARAFSCIARQDINVMAIAQGSSELNISIVIAEDDAARALRSLHKEYGLEKLRPIPHRNPRELNLAIFGFGKIGQTLLKQLQEQKEYLDQRLKLHCPVIGLADRSGIVVAERGFTDPEQKSFFAIKSAKNGLVEDSSAPSVEAQMESHLWHGPWDRRIFIDLTASDSAPTIRKALKNGFHVVLANKKPLTIPHKEYRELLQLAAQNGVQLRYEATVGAGLPVLDTIEKLTTAGDQVLEILGCFSGTLGYLMTELEDGIAFSVAVRQAFEKGYTEPDPRDDLSGMDVARKALILARTMGIAIELEDIALDPLFPAHLSHDDPQTFMANLQALDEAYEARMSSAKAKGCALRYVARIMPGKVTVGVEEISKSDSLGRLRGTDNQVSIKTLRYHSNPLIVTGPGAGAEVTAAGVLNDIITIATSQVHEVKS